jgi:hypothetical protein
MYLLKIFFLYANKYSSHFSFLKVYKQNKKSKNNKLYLNLYFICIKSNLKYTSKFYSILLL